MSSAKGQIMRWVTHELEDGIKFEIVDSLKKNKSNVQKSNLTEIERLVDWIKTEGIKERLEYA